MKTKLSYRNYRETVDEGFNGTKKMNPILRFSPQTGFSVESGLIPKDSDQINIRKFYINANSGEYSIRNSKNYYYKTIRPAILRVLEGSPESFEEAISEIEFENYM